MKPPPQRYGQMPRDRVTRSFSGCLVALVLMTFYSGCASPTSEKNVTLKGTRISATDRRVGVVELVTPDALEVIRMADRKAQEAQTDLYATDSRQPDRDKLLEFGLIQRFSLSLDAFQVDRPEGVGATQFRVRTFRRERTLLNRVYDVSTRWTDWSWKTEEESYPAYWVWDYNGDNRSRVTINFEVKELRGVSGVLSRGQTRTDSDGHLLFDLRPFLDLGAGSERGLTFVFYEPDDGPRCEVVVTQEVFRELR